MCQAVTLAFRGTELITDVLTGAKSAKIRSYHLDMSLLPTIQADPIQKQQFRTWIHELDPAGLPVP